MSFRSHLMQQFAAAARGQSRPPLALATQLCGDSHQQPQSRRTRESASSSSSSLVDVGSTRQQRRTRSSTQPTRPLHASEGATTSNRHIHHRSLSAMPMPSARNETSSDPLPPPGSAADSPTTTPERPDTTPPPTALQSLLTSRRTVSNLVPPDPTIHPPNFLRDALSRAVHCAVQAPNHKRSEPYTFTRLASPSGTTDALANVCYHVSVRRMRERQRGSDSSLLAEAERKRERWRGIPAYLVATVGGMPDQLAGWEDGEDDEYAELPFIPPATERQLEDYAATCAAVQNILLSLHSEGIGSKWATGPVVRTRAFRDVVHIRDNRELVVGLVMVGMPKRVPKGPRRRRDVEGDVLRDV